MSVNLNEFVDEPPARDFRRNNGAPMVKRLGDPSKWERYSRPSGWGEDLDDLSNLTVWRIDRAMDGVAMSPALAASVAAVAGQKEGRKELRDKAIGLGRGEEAADLGTALHKMTERLETEGDGFAAPEPYAADLATYLACLDAAGLASEFIEVHVCSDRWRAAGTCDRIYRTTRGLTMPDGSVVPPGTLLIGDLKTGRKLEYKLPGFSIQLAIYCDGCFYDVDLNERFDFPPNLHTGWGIIVHLPVGQAHCELLWCDLTVGRIGAALVQQVRAWRKRKDFAVPFTMPASDEVAVLSEPVTFSIETIESSEVTPEEWTLAMASWAQARINEIGKLPEARAMLLRRWPAELPPLRAGDFTAAHVSETLDLVAAIEAAFDLPFPAGDPREEWNRGLHASEGVQGHQPPTKEP